LFSFCKKRDERKKNRKEEEKKGKKRKEEEKERTKFENPFFIGLKWSEGQWKNLHFLRRRVYDINCNWKVLFFSFALFFLIDFQVYCDNYLDGGYHIPILHLGLNSELEMKSYKTTLHKWASIQKCKSKVVLVARLFFGF
jgi:hypothetical protein